MRRRRRHDLQISFFSFQDIIMTLAGIMIFIALMLVLDVTTTAMSSHTADTAHVPQVSAPTPAEAQKKAADLQNLLEKLREQSRQLAAANRLTAADDSATLRKKIVEIEAQLEQARTTGAAQAQARLTREAAIARLIAERSREVAQIKAIAVEKAALDAVARRVVFTLPDDGSTRKEVIIVEISANLVRIGLLGDGMEIHRVTETAPGAREASVVGAIRGHSPSTHDLLILYKPSGFSDGTEWRDLFQNMNYRTGWDMLEEDRSSLTS